MMEVHKHTCMLTLLTFFSATYASSRYWKFSKDFGGDCKSTRSVIETTSGPGLTTRRCGARCMDDIQCNGFNFVSGSVPQCTLIQGITESVDIQAETGTVFYQQQDIDDCISGTCQNNATCADGFHAYSCICAAGYTGVDCETELDECASSPCLNYGTCVDDINGHTCVCPDGYTGIICETELDECASSPCQNYGTCVDDINGHTCVCPDGYTGIICETADPVIDCLGSSFVPRAAWGARLPETACCVQLSLPMSKVFVHHSYGPHCTSLSQCAATVRGIQNYHMDTNNWDDVGYNFLVGEDGRIYEGRGWNNQGAHTYSYNGVSHGICYLGDYMTTGPAQVALDAGNLLVQCGITHGMISPSYQIYGHRDAVCTLCPGDALYAIIQTYPQFANEYLPGSCPPTLTTTAPASVTTTANCVTTETIPAVTGCSAVTIVDRASWGARAPKSGCCTLLVLPLSNTYISHSVGPHCTSPAACISTVQAIQDLHMDGNGWDDIGYNFVVGEDGRVYVGRGWANQGAHTSGNNHLGYGINFMGDFMSVAPNQIALDAAQALMQCGVDMGNLAPDYVLYGHKDKTSTSSPGDVLYGIIQGWPHYP